MTTKNRASSSTAEPTIAERYISRSKQTIQASRELISNSRIMKLTSVARFTKQQGESGGSKGCGVVSRQMNCKRD